LQRLLLVQQTNTASSEVMQVVMKMLDQINQVAQGT